MEEPMSEATTTTEATAKPDDAASTAETTTTQTQGDPAELGDAGKKALDAERTARKAAEKAAADMKAQLDQINQANESAVEKAQREAKEAQEAATKATAEALRFRVAAKHGISDEDAELFLTGSDAETVERQAAALVARTPTGPRPDPSQGAKGTAGAKTPADSFAEFFRDNI
jgi:hypothetical protein